MNEFVFSGVRNLHELAFRLSSCFGFRFVDALEDSTSSDEDETMVPKAPKRKLTIDDLEKCGYKDRPSILFIPEPKQEVEQTPSHIKYSPLQLLLMMYFRRDGGDQSKNQIEETIEVCC